jgi:CubicO group peptidase (beta-lactamase class C family)
MKTAADLGVMVGFPPPVDKCATHHNWQQPPFNRWSFQNVRSVIPTRVVARSRASSSALAEAAEALDGLAFAESDGRRMTIADMLEETYTDGFILLHRGRIVFERYMNGMTPATLHLSQSVSKSLVGVLIGITNAAGAIDLDATLSRYVPELSRSGYGDATIAQVLDMRSGVRFVENYSDPNSDAALLDRACNWKPSELTDPNGIYELILRLKKERPHGGHFSYRSVETDVLAWVLERATSVGLAELMSDRLWQPMGAERDASFTVDRVGTCLADGGLNACLRDYARFGQMMLDEGSIGGHQIVPASWVAACRTGDVSAFKPLYGARFAAFPNACYSRQFWVLDRSLGLHAAFGVFGQMIYLNPVTQSVAVKLSSWPDFINDPMRMMTLRGIDAMVRAL